MKPITVHPGSALIGGALAFVAFLATGAQTPVVESVLHRAPRDVEVRVQGIADPRDAVLVRQLDGPYAVPQGKVLVITAMGGPGFSGGWGLQIDGIPTLNVANSAGSTPAMSLTAVPAPGLPVRAGSVVTIGSTNQYDSFLGYLLEE